LRNIGQLSLASLRGR